MIGTIPAAVKTLIKTQDMTGDNRPYQRVTIGGVSGGSRTWEDLADATRITQGQGSTSYPNMSNFVQTTAGTFVSAWVDGSLNVILGTTATEDFFTTNYCIDSTADTGIDVEYHKPNGIVLYRTSTGKLLMIVSDYINDGGTNKTAVYCYESANGNGTDFTLKSTVLELATESNAGNGINIPLLTSTGRLILTASLGCTTGFGDVVEVFVFVSDDLGATWTKVYQYSNYNWGLDCGPAVQLPDGTIYFHDDWSSGGIALTYSTDDGDTWSRRSQVLNYQEMSYLYDSYTGCVIATNAINFFVLTNPTLARFETLSAWTEYDIPNMASADHAPRLTIMPSGDLCIHFKDSNATPISVIYGISVDTQVLPVRSIAIQDALGMDASSATVVVDNTGGAWSPESDTTEHSAALLPNKTITIELGYGSNIVQRFKGYIDRVSPGAHPAEIVIVARDVLKLAVDQIATAATGEFVYTYAAQSVYTWLTSFATRCGLTYDCEACTIQVDEKTINWESYADIFNFCCDIAGFEYYADAQGVVHFRYVTDRQPEAVDEGVVLNGTTDVNIVNYPVVTAGIRVWSAAGETGTQYTVDTDYTITAGTATTPWKIKRIAGGTIGDGATVYLTYVYAAWSFAEGVDMISIEYNYEDADLYKRVYVIGKDSDDTALTAYADIAGTGVSDLPATKYYKVEIPEVSDADTLALIAARLKKEIETKLRRCHIKTIGVPWIEAGDCIQAEETTTGMSEIYRITDMTINFDADSDEKLTTDFDCYHYGYAPV